MGITKCIVGGTNCFVLSFKNLYIVYMNTKSFWSRVKVRIKEKAVTQAETAKVCGLSYSKFRNWMSKNMIPPLNYADRLARYLGVSLEYLIDGKGTDKFSKINEEILVLLKKAEEKMTEVRRVDL